MNVSVVNRQTAVEIPPRLMTRLRRVVAETLSRSDDTASARGAGSDTADTGGAAGPVVDVTLADAPTIRRLNRDYRGIDDTTDVLSFGDEGPDAAAPVRVLGDVIIYAQQAAEQAETYGHSLERELCFLAVHGTLHLLGWDHRDEPEETAMRDKTEAILGTFGLTRSS